MKTHLGKAYEDRVLVRGMDLTSELLGSTSYTDMVSIMLLGRRPTADETKMLDALLVILVEHGLVKPVVAARFVYSNAPESLQAAVAASLLGAGSRHLGSSEWCAELLQKALPRAVIEAGVGDAIALEAALEAAAQQIVAGQAERGERVPGIGHRTHPEGDPRAVRLYDLARETGTFGVYSRLLLRVAELAGERAGRPLPVNVTGAIASIASDMGFRWEITRGFALIGRVLGALAHIQEEMDEPISDELIRNVQKSVEYDA